MPTEPLIGDRSVFDTINYPERHAADLVGSPPPTTVHLPPPEGAEMFLYCADGIHWSQITVSELCIILGITPPSS